MSNLKAVLLLTQLVLSALAHGASIELPDLAKFSETTKTRFQEIHDHTAAFIPRNTACPLATSWLLMVFDRLVHGSNLERNVASQPEVVVTASCYEFKNRDGTANYYSIIEPPAGMLYDIHSEDEFTFILGHELSHAILAHGLARMECIATHGCEPLDLVSAQEREADLTSLKLLVNAGYDPYASIAAFKWLKRIIGNAGGVHGTIDERISRLKSAIQAAGYKPQRLEPHLPSNARNELKALSKPSRKGS